MDGADNHVEAISKKMNVVINLLYKLAESEGEKQTADAKIIFLHLSGLTNPEIVEITGKDAHYVSKRIGIYRTKAKGEA
jgi:hypothetical protein